MKIGYARVSSADQDYEVQRQRLEQAGCSPIRCEKVSGKSREGRDELAAVLDFVRDGDELVVCKLDRLGRSTRDVLNIVHELEAKGASLRVLEPEITTSGPLGRMVITTLGMVAELERTMLRERQRAGIDAAKKRGVYRGRRKRVDTQAILRMKQAGRTPTEIASALQISRATVHRELKANREVRSTDGT